MRRPLLPGYRYTQDQFAGYQQRSNEPLADHCLLISFCVSSHKVPLPFKHSHLSRFVSAGQEGNQPNTGMRLRLIGWAGLNSLSCSAFSTATPAMSCLLVTSSCVMLSRIDLTWSSNCRTGREGSGERGGGEGEREEGRERGRRGGRE